MSRKESLLTCRYSTIITLFSLTAHSYLVLCLLFSIHTAKAVVWALITLTASKSSFLASTRATNICSQCCCRDGFDLSLWQRCPQRCIPTRPFLSPLHQSLTTCLQIPPIKKTFAPLLNPIFLRDGAPAMHDTKHHVQERKLKVIKYTMLNKDGSTQAECKSQIGTYVLKKIDCIITFWYVKISHWLLRFTQMSGWFKRLLSKLLCYLNSEVLCLALRGCHWLSCVWLLEGYSTTQRQWVYQNLALDIKFSLKYSPLTSYSDLKS